MKSTAYREYVTGATLFLVALFALIVALGLTGCATARRELLGQVPGFRVDATDGKVGGIVPDRIVAGVADKLGQDTAATWLREQSAMADFYRETRPIVAGWTTNWYCLLPDGTQWHIPYPVFQQRVPLIIAPAPQQVFAGGAAGASNVAPPVVTVSFPVPSAADHAHPPAPPGGGGTPILTGPDTGSVEQ